MPIAAVCPNCGAPISDTAIIALAPVCTHCRSVITNVGGSLGLTGVYGVNDTMLTRARVEADLRVFRDHLAKYNGMREHCLQKLQWSAEPYAKLPPPPTLLTLEELPSLTALIGAGIMGSVICFPVWFVSNLAIPILSLPVALFFEHSTLAKFLNSLVGFLWTWNAFWSGVVLVWLGCLVPYFVAIARNGTRPMENTRRQRKYENDRSAALKAAEPLKAAEDHRLRVKFGSLKL